MGGVGAGVLGEIGLPSRSENVGAGVGEHMARFRSCSKSHILMIQSVSALENLNRDLDENEQSVEISYLNNLVNARTVFVL